MIKTVTFGVIAYNEKEYLPALLSDLLEQTYPHDLIEVVLVDGNSDDNTKRIMQEFCEAHRSEFKEIKVIDNVKRNQPAGWNIVIKNSSSDVVLRIDAHARLPKDFVRKNMECILSGEFVCGGPRENIIDEDTPWKRMLLTAEQSMFGSGIAAYRNATEEKRYVKSVFHGAYRKSVIEKVGLFNEKLIRTEDNEYHYRVNKAGFRICYDPQIKSYYQTRNTLQRMLRQKYQNGFWIGKTLYFCPGCISLFHLVPFGFVIAIGMTALLGLLGVYWPMSLLWIAYAAANLAMTIMAILSSKKRDLILLVLPFVFLSLHICYGIGTVVGLASGRK